ncbi:MAG TPA: hypothetical protein VFG20_04705 [Planctomycetaceae bacterium]|nr:hypothetical protein [Planctomycetaceae bacterium]
MTRHFGYGLLACCLLGGVIHADEADELRARAIQLKAKAAQLLERGNETDAARLTQEARELLLRAERLEGRLEEPVLEPPPPALARETELRRLHSRLKDLQSANRALWASDAPSEELVDLRAQIRQVERLIAAKTGATPPQDTLQQVEHQLQRIDHIRAAAQHMQAAEMPDVARHLRDHAQNLEREARMLLESVEHRVTPLPPAAEPPSADKAVERALRQEIEALRNELEALRRQRNP